MTSEALTEIRALSPTPAGPVAEAARVLMNAMEDGDRPATYWNKAWAAMRQDVASKDAPTAFFEGVRALAQKEEGQ